MKKHLKISLLVIGIIGCVFADALMAQSEVVAYANAYQSWDAFNNTKDDTIRTKAFEWTKQHAEHCQNNDIRITYINFGNMARELGRNDEYEKTCFERIKRENIDVGSYISTLLCDWYIKNEMYDKGLSLVTSYLKDAAEFSPEKLGMFAERAVTILSKKMVRHEDASKLLSDTTELVKDNPALFASIANIHAELLYSTLSNITGAEKLCSQVLELGNQCPPDSYFSSAYMLAKIVYGNRNTEKTIDTLMLTLKHQSLPPRGIAKRLIDMNAPFEKLDECVSLLRQRMIADIPTQNEQQLRDCVERIQPELIKLLIALGRKDEALGECRVYLFATQMNNYAGGVDLIAETLRVCDNNFYRINAFLNFQRASAEELKTQNNPIMGFPQLNDAVRMGILKSFEDNAPPIDHSGWRMRSLYLIWLDRPAEAMNAAVNALMASPMSTGSLQSCANAVVWPLLVATRDTAFAQSVVDYLLWGEAGADGILGTSDDIVNPLPEARKRLTYSTQQ